MKIEIDPKDLGLLQQLSLSDKIQWANMKIEEWYKHYNGQVYVAFSGGKDSTVLLHLVRKLYPEVPAVFVDTGLEFPEIKEFVKKQENVTILRPKKSFRQIIHDYGYPLVSKETAKAIYEIKTTKSKKLKNKRLYGDEKGKSGTLSKKWRFLLNAPFKVSDRCCYFMKKSPFYSYERKTGRKSFTGILAEESALRKQSWKKYGCNAFDLTHPQSRPLMVWSEQDILNYIKLNSIQIADVYGEIVEENGKLKTTGAVRTGCIFCAFGCHLEKESRFKKLQKTHPQLYNYCMKDVESGGLGLDRVLNYLEIEH